MPRRWFFLLSAILFAPAAVAVSYTDCHRDACATLTVPTCAAPGEPFTLGVEGALENAGGFAVTAWGLFEGGEASFTPEHQMLFEGGERLAARGFNWGAGYSGQFTLTRPAGRYLYRFVFGPRSFSHGSYDAMAEAEVTVGGAVEAVAVDIKPGSCPNPLHRDRGGVISVALVGGVGDSGAVPAAVDPATVRLEGVAPIHFSYEDAATPYLPLTGRVGEEACHDAGGDGTLDLVLKFRAEALTAALERRLGRSLEPFEALTVELTAARGDGGPCGGLLRGEDVIRIQGSGRPR